MLSTGEEAGLASDTPHTDTHHHRHDLAAEFTNKFHRLFVSLQMSNDTLTWLLTKNTSSFLVKRNYNEFAKEKFNLLNQNSRKYSGLACAKAVDISLNDKKITLTTKIGKAARKPLTAVNEVPLRKGARGGANTIRANISRNYYRRDLKKAALAKWSQLSTVAKVEKGVLKKKTIRSRRTKA